MTDYKMPSLRPNGNTSTMARPHVFPLPDDTVADEPQPPVSPTSLPEELENETRKGALAKVSDWSRGAIARESDRAARARGFWGEHPPSLSMLREWIHTTRWYRSESGLKKALAWIDGYLLVMPVTALLYIAAWIWQRPLRRLVAAVFATIIYLYL
jgi:hypothetical protein